MQPKPKLRRAALLLLGAAVLAGGLIFNAEYSSTHTLQAASIPASSQVMSSPESGKAIYEQHCLACHAVEGKGFNKYPPLVSDHVKKARGTYDKAYEFISRNMPDNAPGSLTEAEYNAVTKYVLALNGIPTDFNDIEGHWAQKEITELFDKKYIDGYKDKQQTALSFKPNQNITRAEFVRYLVKSKELFLSNNTESEFTDISGNKDDLKYIITAVEYGLINGYPDHTFRPNASISRAEIASILARSEMLKPSGESHFKDIGPDYWAGDAIRSVQQAQLFNGYEDGTFRPDQKMTRGEAVAVIYRLIHPAV